MMKLIVGLVVMASISAFAQTVSQRDSIAEPFRSLCGDVFDQVEGANYASGPSTSDDVFRTQQVESKKLISRLRRLAKSPSEIKAIAALARYSNQIDVCRMTLGLHDSLKEQQCGDELSKIRDSAMKVAGIVLSPLQ